MKRISLILISIALAVSSCTKEDISPAPFSVGALVQSPVDGTVVRVLDVNDYSFTGVIVDAVNPQSLCSVVGAVKSEYSPCETCIDLCK